MHASALRSLDFVDATFVDATFVDATFVDATFGDAVTGIRTRRLHLGAFNQLLW